MPLRQLNLNDDTTTPAQPTVTPDQPRVDDPMLSSHNQPAATGDAKKSPTSEMKKRPLTPILLTVVVTVFLGVATGYFLNQKLPSGVLPGSSATPMAQVASGDVKAGDVFGSANTDSFKDSATGFLAVGGLEGEGSHRLLRPGGENQTVYLTSSVTDLSKFEGMDVKVWGETFRGQKAGWLMDVGRVEVVNPQGQEPE